MEQNEMTFSRQLEILLRIFRLSNITLARGMGADPSLVSRWRSGERVPRINGPTRGILAQFLSGVPMLPLDLQQLTQITGGLCDTRERMEDTILCWLYGKTPSYPCENPANITLTLESEHTPEQTAASHKKAAVDIIEKMSGVLYSTYHTDSGPVNLWPHVQKGSPNEHEIFRDEKGRRQAAINFLHAVQSSGKMTDVYLMAWGNTGWMRDAAFQAMWLKALRALVQNGHTIHILVPKVSDFSELSNLLDLPLYKMGRCMLYTCPEQPIAHPTLFVARGIAAVLSYGQEQTLLFRNIQDISLFESVFHLWLEQSEPLFYSCDSPMSYAQRLVQLEEKPGAYYSLKSSISSMLLPESVTYELLSASLSPNEVAARLDILAKRREIFESALGRDTWVEIYPQEVFDAITINGSCRLSGLELFFEQDATISGEPLVTFLQNLIERLKTRENLHIVLLGDEYFPVNISLKSGQGAFFTANSAQKGMLSAYLGEMRLLDELEKWLVSHTMNKEEVLELIEDALRGVLP